MNSQSCVSQFSRRLQIRIRAISNAHCVESTKRFLGGMAQQPNSLVVLPVWRSLITVCLLPVRRKKHHQLATTALNLATQSILTAAEQALLPKPHPAHTPLLLANLLLMLFISTHGFVLSTVGKQPYRQLIGQPLNPPAAGPSNRAPASATRALKPPRIPTD